MHCGGNDTIPFGRRRLQKGSKNIKSKFAETGCNISGQTKKTKMAL